MQLDELQRRVAGIYDAQADYAVEDFLITDAALAGALTPRGTRDTQDERLLVSEDGETLELALYLDEALLERLAEADPLQALTDAAMADFLTAVEGISHFNYVAFKAGADTSVTLLELELQAEIDKYVSTLLLAQEQGHRGVGAALHRRLFDAAGFDPAMDAEEHERYRVASDYAGRYCHALAARLERGDEPVMRELRAFYRYTQAAKISHIHHVAHG